MSPSPKSADVDAAFRKYEVEIRAHGLDWWTRDSRVEEVLARHPELVDPLAERAMKGESIETKDIHYIDPSSGWRPTRQTMHDELVASLFGRHFATVINPAAIFLLGLPGSGKSTVLKRIAKGYLNELGNEHAVARDADEVRIRLPEYSGGRGSQIVQSEVVDITYGQATHALPDDGHLLIDLVGDPSWLPREVEYFAQQDRTIVMLCSELPIEIAEQRAKERALRDGRYVSIAYLQSCAGRPRAALESALETALVDHWALIDTAGSAPRVIDGDEYFGSPGDTARFWS